MCTCMYACTWCSVFLLLLGSTAFVGVCVSICVRDSGTERMTTHYVYVHTCINACACVPIYLCVHIYVYAYLHAYYFTYIYIHICIFVCICIYSQTNKYLTDAAPWKPDAAPRRERIIRTVHIYTHI